MKARCAILLAAVALGCAAERPAARQAEEPAAPAVASSKAPPGAASGEEKSGYLPEIDAALEFMTTVRELSAKERVQGTVIQRDALLERLRTDVTADLETELVLGTTELLFSLNVVPGSFDFLKDVTGLYTSQLAGFYDPEEKRMYLLADLGEDAERSTLWHELVHALQDQHYDLKKIADWSPDATDRMSAIQCLAEGDATSAMMDAMLAPQGTLATDLPDGFLGPDSVLIEGNVALRDVPPVLKRSIMAPYSDGVGFVHYLRRKGGWASVDQAWQKLPQSTEQILHPEKYLAGEAPEVVPVPPPPVNGATLAYRDVLGEQTFRLLFQDWLPARTAAESAGDWSGDRVAVYTWGTTRAVGLRLRFDKPEAAERAAHAFVRGALGPEFERGASPGAGLPPVSAETATRSFKAGQFCAERESRGPFAVERRGRELAVALGPFTRTGSAPKSAGACSDALVWTKSILDAH
jgi:hypothetical protein